MTGFDSFFPERAPRANSFWSVERIDLLRKLWAEGLSASQITERIPGATRASVLGAVNRNDMPACRTGRHSDLHRPFARRPRELTPAERKEIRSTGFNKDRPASIPVYGGKPTKFDLAVPAEQRRQLHELEVNQCRWPIGDPREAATFFFCAGATKSKATYCAHHNKRAYNK